MGRTGRITDRAAAAFSRLPWWLQVTAVYGLARVFSFAVLTAASAKQITSPWAATAPSYLEFVNFWDSGWYQRIYEEGYPSVLPRDAEGAVAENQWAFHLLFPTLVRLAGLVTGAEWIPVAPVVATAFGFAAALVIFKLFRMRAGHADSLWAIALVAFFPTSPILQIPYAESLHLFLLALALLLVARGRHLTAIPVVVLMCLARPAGVPFAMLAAGLLLIHLPAQWRSDRQRVIRLAALTSSSALAAVAWPLIAWVVTGEPSAYVETETVWRGEELVPFLPWWTASVRFLGGAVGPLALIGIVAATVWFLFSTPGRRLGVHLQLWCGAYLLYLAAFWNPQTSTFRILLPLFPLALAAVFGSRSRAYRLVLVAGFAVLQIVWVTWLWAWTPLPSGGDYSP